MKSTVCLLALIPMVFVANICRSESVSTSAPERASELKVWREQCNDPDYDLRLAYIEQAIAKGDVSIQRICIRAALESDNGDIKNLGLRAAIASTPKIFFDVKMPNELEDAVKKAGTDEKKLKEIDSWDITRAYKYLSGGVSFIIQEAIILKDVSTWYSIGRNAEKEDKYRGSAHIIGSKIKWAGLILSSGAPKCDLNVQLLAGGSLEGTLQCENWWPYNVTAKLQ